MTTQMKDYMMNSRDLLIGVSLLLAAATAQASSEISFALSSDMVSADYLSISDDSGSQWGFGALYSDDAHATLVFGTFNVMGKMGSDSGFSSGLGGKILVHDTFQTAGSLALGGKVRFAPEAWSGIGFEGGVYIAPNMLNTNDAEQYFEIIARAAYSVNDNSRVFVGWQNIDVKYDDAEVSKVDLDSGLNVGFSLTF